MIRVVAACLCLLPLASAEPGPGEAAVRFLERIRDDELDLDGDTALSPDTTREKVHSIRERLDRLGKLLQQGELKPVDRKIDGEVAAALVSQSAGLDASTAQVHAIGLVLRDGVWLPAPVPASFENTGLTYHPRLGAAARRLEKWMLEERPARLETFRAELDARLLSEVRKSKVRDLLRTATPVELVEAFMAACRDRDLPSVLAFLGGLEEDLPGDWQDLVPLVANGLRATGGAKEAWSSLLDARLLRAVVAKRVEESRAEVSLGLFDPTDARADRDDVAIREFELSRGPAGSWRLRLPEWLVTADDEERGDLKLRKAFPLALLNNREPRAFPDPIELGETMMRGLSAPNPDALFGLIAAEGESEALRALLSYTRLWRQRRDSTDLGIMLDVRVEKDRACGIYCLLDPYNPRIRKDLLHPILMTRGDDGWRLETDAAPQADRLPAPFRKWFEDCLERDRVEWLACLGLDERLGGLPAGAAPEADAARRLAGEWVDALESRDPRRILRHTAMFDDDRSVRRLFAFLGQELPSVSTLEILGMHHHGRWAAASIRHRPPAGPDDAPTDLLHPMVSTASGPRVLPEAILYAADTRARTVLNNEVWKRLGERLPEEAVDELRTILEAHEKLCQPADAPAE